MIGALETYVISPFLFFVGLKDESVNLSKLIKAEILADVSSIHRMTIDRATEIKETWVIENDIYYW